MASDGRDRASKGVTGRAVELQRELAPGGVAAEMRGEALGQGSQKACEGRHPRTLMVFVA